MPELTDTELKNIILEAKAKLLDQMQGEFKRSSLYEGRDIRLWLGSYANQMRRAILKDA